MPEDYTMRGHLYGQHYFPKTWFEDAKVDYEERRLEQPSMTALHIKRMLWLGIRIASVCVLHFCYPACAKLIHPVQSMDTFLIAKHGAELLEGSELGNGM